MLRGKKTKDEEGHEMSGEETEILDRVVSKRPH